jgi:hypothetical protein
MFALQIKPSNSPKSANEARHCRAYLWWDRKAFEPHCTYVSLDSVAITGTHELQLFEGN